MLGPEITMPKPSAIIKACRRLDGVATLPAGSQEFSGRENINGFVPAVKRVSGGWRVDIFIAAINNVIHKVFRILFWVTS